MLSSSSKYKADLKADKNIEKILIGCKLNTDLLIAEENNNIILYNIKSGKKIVAIPFHNKRITSFHIVKRPLYIDNKQISFSNDSFYFLTSSLDKKFALHQISYNNSTKEYSNYKLISQCQPTNDEVNRVIQIENGQILVATRDQHLILFNSKITKGNFEKLFEIKKKWPINAISLFEIRNNLIGVFWEFDDASYDTPSTEDRFLKKHSNDGLYIYSIQNNKIFEKKNFKFMSESFWKLKRNKEKKYSYVIINNKLILKKNKEIDVYDLNNYSFLFKFNFDFNEFNICPCNEKYFSIFYKEGTKAIIKLYNINSMKNEQTFEFFGKYNSNLFPISNNEYVFDDLIITIAEV